MRPYTGAVCDAVAGVCGPRLLRVAAAAAAGQPHGAGVVRAVRDPPLRRRRNAAPSYLQAQGTFLLLFLSTTTGQRLFSSFSDPHPLTDLLQGKPEWVKPEGSPAKKKKKSHKIVDGTAVVADSGIRAQ